VSLRALLIQGAARLQEWPALTAPGWDTLLYPAFRNRVEGVALGLMAPGPPLASGLYSCTGTPWDWACEVACACCGLRWDPAAPEADAAILGGDRFNDEEGRQPYHDRDHELDADTPFLGELTHGDLAMLLRRLNGKLGWDQETTITLPLSQLHTREVRTALWSALYGGSHAILRPQVADWDPEPFKGVL